MGRNSNNKAGVIVDNIQGITISSVTHAELALKIRLPHLIAQRFLKPSKGLALLSFLWADAAVTIEDIVDRFGARDICVALCQENIPNRFGAPARVVRSDV